MVADAIAKGYLESGEKYYVMNLPTHEVANEARRSVVAALRRANLAKASWVVDSDRNPCYRSCKDPEGPHGVGFQLYSKNAARAYIAAQSKGDPANLKYNPFQRGTRARFNDDGQQLD